MTVSKLALITLLQWIIIIALKVVYFKGLFFSGAALDYAYWAAIAIVATALVRRFGVINYLEAFFVVIVWVSTDLLLDLMVTSGIVGLSIFSNIQMWTGYLVMAIFIVFCNKTRHVAIRKGVYQDPHHH